VCVCVCVCVCACVCACVLYGVCHSRDVIRASEREGERGVQTGTDQYENEWAEHSSS
jgi:hypothetical protein